MTNTANTPVQSLEKEAVSISVKDIDEKEYMQASDRVIGYFEGKEYFFKDASGNVFGPMPDNYRHHAPYTGVKVANDTLYFSELDRKNNQCSIQEWNQETKDVKTIFTRPSNEVISEFSVTKDKKVIEHNGGVVTESGRIVYHKNLKPKIAYTSDGWYAILSPADSSHNMVLQLNGDEEIKTSCPYDNVLYNRIDMNAGIVALPMDDKTIQLYTKQGKVSEMSYEGILTALKITDNGDVIYLSSDENSLTYLTVNGEKQKLPLYMKQHQGKIIESHTLNNIVIQAAETSGLFKELSVSFDPDAVNILAAQNVREEALKNQESLVKILNAEAISAEDLQKLLDSREILVEQEGKIRKLLENEQESATTINQNAITITTLESQNKILSERNTKMKASLETIADLATAKITKENAIKGGIFGSGGPNKDTLAEYNEILAQTKTAEDS